ncbi:helix-turn-helix domain-containing protein [Fusobacterium necrophorum]|uniref:helix-turn-helix domain-containing protein n=1 Tax=Fusobacterium necrophorum TaxID=859 RepID=UPI0021C41C25|nr:helix-turn-helix domain-containing protein [Fusobacterium necrophorum]
MAAETAGVGQTKQENTLFQYSQYLIEDYFDSLSTVGAAMSIEERMKVVEDLQQKGIFQLKGNISTVAKKLEISEKTLYRYLKSQS